MLSLHYSNVVVIITTQRIYEKQDLLATIFFRRQASRHLSFQVQTQLLCIV